MLSRPRPGLFPQVALLVLGVSACAGNSDINTPAGTGGNQSGNSGSGGASGTAGTSGSAGTIGNAGTNGTGGSAGSSAIGVAGTGGASATGTAGAGASTATGTAGSAAGRGGTNGTAGTGGGASGRGGTTGTAGTGAGAAGRGGTTGTAGSTGTAGTTGAGGGLIWPNDTSSANSDDWLVQNHDKISQLRPRVLAMDIGNTSNASTLIQRHIDGLANATSFHKYSEAAAQPMVVYQLVKVVTGTSPDYASWNTQSFADSAIQIKDPKDPSGPNLTLCQLFEKGIINEVWCMATQNQTKCGETQEGKVVYTNADPPVKASPLKVVNASNGDDITRSLPCKVSTRVIDFNTSRGVGCHQHALGHGWERYMDAQAIPLLRKQAARFLNWDLNTRVGAPFSNFYSACNSNGSQLTDCILWDSQIAIHNGPTASKTFNISDMSGGCGNAHFYPNTTGTYSYDANTPDPMVLSSCEHYGLHDGTGGKDMTTPFTNKMTDDLAKAQQGGGCTAGSPYCSTDDDCGGHGTSYLYQSFPSYGTAAKNDDMTPMHNWWVYLFY
jgi:hypothetical protein